MQTIWKFQLEAKGMQRIYMPTDADILHVHEQDGSICLWAAVNTTLATQERVIEVFPTGVEMPNDMSVDRAYIGTVHLRNGELVFHVYERIY